jgi:hypothetical protein
VFVVNEDIGFLVALAADGLTGALPALDGVNFTSFWFINAEKSWIEIPPDRR